MATVTVRASSAPAVAAAATQVIPFPGTPQVGDPIGIWLTTNASNTLVTGVPAGWSISYAAAMGTGSRSFISKVYAAGDGSGVSVTFGATPGGVSAAVVVLDGSVHAGFGTLGAVTSRGATIATTTAAATGSSAAPNLVVSHEKGATHATPPTVSPATTTVQNVTNAAASSGSVYVGWYDTAGGTADRTITYPVTSANGSALQIPVLPQTVTPPPPTGPVVKVLSGATEQAATVKVWTGAAEAAGTLTLA